jgi:4-carboxymuconolactone decarboxylase
MKLAKLPLFAAAIASLSVLAAACSDSTRPTSTAAGTPADVAPVQSVEAVSPALGHYRDDVLMGDLWTRPGLSPRDRSLVTVSALITNNQTVEMPYYLNMALDNGLTAAEVSETITHLAFYAGWPNAMSAVAVARDVLAQKGIGTEQLPVADAELLPLDESAEAQRQTSNDANYGAVAPGVLQYTTDVVFRDLWLRPGLAPRDRSLVTVAALVASGQSAQITYHPRAGHGQRTDPGTGVRGADPAGVLHGLAQGVHRAAGRQGRIRQPHPVIGHKDLTEPELPRLQHLLGVMKGRPSCEEPSLRRPRRTARGAPRAGHRRTYRRDRPQRRHLRLRVGSLGLPRHQPGPAAQTVRPRILRHRRSGRLRGHHGETGRLRHRLVLRFRWHLPELPQRIPDIVSVP